jgi:hypothetical protein
LVCEPIAPGTISAATAAAEPLDEPPGVCSRLRAAGPELRAELRWHVGGVENVLDADRYAMQRTGRPAAAALVVGGLRLPHRVVAIEKCPRLDIAVHLVDAFQTVADQLDRFHPPFADIGGSLSEAEGAKTHCRASLTSKSVTAWTSNPAATAPCRERCTSAP